MAETTRPADAQQKAFLERMEQQRLRQPSVRIIDMRGRVPGKCREYPHGAQIHFMDERSIALFEAALREYGGQYTAGVYERVINADHTYRAQDERGAGKDSDTGEDNALRVIDFGYRPQRGESRLNYVSAINIELEDGRRLSGKTLDLSLLGVRVSLGLDAPLQKDLRLYVRFEEMQQRSRAEFGPIAYQVVGIDTENDRKVVRLKRLMRAIEREFDRFVPQYIQSLTMRYKLELKDALPATYARVFERIYTQRTGALHACFEVKDGVAEYLFASGNTDFAWGEQPQLAALAARQLAKLVPAADLDNVDHTALPAPQWLYALRLPGTPGRAFVVPAGALADKTRRSQWFSLMRAAESAQAYALAWHRMQTPENVQIDSILDLLPDSLDAARKLWQQRVDRVSHVCTLLPVPSLLTPEPLADEAKIPDWLPAFEVPLQTPPAVIGMGVRGGRTQERYLYATRAVVESGQGRHAGETLDFSINGLKVLLDVPSPLKARDQVLLSFPALQEKIKDPSELAQQAYRVVRVLRNGQLLCLERDHREVAHKAARFFAGVIQNNQHRLATCTAEQLATTEARLGELLVARNLGSLPLFLCRDADKKPSLFACARNSDNRLLEFFDAGDHLALNVLNQRELMQAILYEACNNVGTIDKEKRGLLVWVRSGTQWKAAVVEARLPVAQRIALLRSALQRPGARIYAFSLAPPAVLDRNETDDDLQPILRNSRYRADLFRTELSRLIGLCELIEVTPGVAAELAVLDA